MASRILGTLKVDGATEITGTTKILNNLMVSGSLFVTGSFQVASQGTTFPSDSHFFVSGTQGITGAGAKIAVFGGDVIISGSLIGVASVASSASLSSLNPPDGSTYYVKNSASQWIFTSGSTLTPFESVVVSASLGRWIRTSFAHPKWTKQSVWFIHSGSGHDENDGFTSGSALKTHAELERRWGSIAVLTQSVTVNILSNLQEVIKANIKIDDNGGAIASQVTYLGTVQQTLATGTFSAVTLENTAGSIPISVTNGDPGFDWNTSGPAGSTLVGKRIRRLSDNAVSWIVKRVSASEARTGPWCVSNPTDSPFPASVTNINPAISDSFVVEQLPTVLGANINIERGSNRTTGADFYCAVIDSIEFSGGSDYGKRFSTGLSKGTTMLLVINRSKFTNASNGLFLDGELRQCFVTTASSRASIASTKGASLTACSNINGWTFSQGTPINISGGGIVQTGKIAIISNGFVSLASSVGIFDGTGATLGGVDLSRFGKIVALTAAVIYGSQAQGPGIKVQGGCMFVYTTKPTISGSSPGINDAEVAGRNYAWTSMPVFDTTKACGIVAT